MTVWFDATVDFVTACVGTVEGDPTPLEWLSSLLSTLRDTEWTRSMAGDDDPQAHATALTEAENLLDGLRAAVRKATDER